MGSYALWSEPIYIEYLVSIQLVSPTSGESMPYGMIHIPYVRFLHVSIQLVSPTSGEKGLRAIARAVTPAVSIQLVSPTSGEGD